MRMSGLASGLDIDSMVKELMKARRTSYDNMVKQRTKVEWQQEDYRSMSTKIVDFRNTKLQSFNLSTAISAKKSEVSGDANALTVNSTTSTAAGSLTIKVNTVATAATDVYNFPGGTTDGLPPSTVTDKPLSALGFEEDGTTGEVVIKVNDKTIRISQSATLKDLAKAINADSSTSKATAVYNSATGQFSITGNNTGVSSLNVDGFSLSALKTPVSVGTDASVSINGITYTQSSNRFTNSGIDFTVKAVSATNSSTVITTQQDTSKIIDTIKSFVSEYNSLISSINSELNETRERNYNPLTSEEKKEMTDDEIKLWETKAKNGALRNDSILSKYVSDLRLAANSLVAGINDGGNKISIGITTGSYTEKGKLILDEDKLKSALDSNPDQVIRLFSASSSDNSAGSTTSGVFAKMTASSLTALTSLTAKAGTSLTSKDTTATFLESSLLSAQTKQMKTREELLLDRLDMMEKQYYKQFTAMETAINKFNSQSSSLSSFSS